MRRLVVQDSADIVADAGFVDSQIASYILFLEYPFRSMVFLDSVLVSTQDIPVVLLKSIAIDAISPP